MGLKFNLITNRPNLCLMRSRFITFFILILVAFNLNCSAQSKNKSDNNRVQVVFLGGQSNMAGKGVYDELSKADKERIEKVSKRVMVSTSGRLPYPLSYFSAEKKQKNFGPELFIGLTLAENNPYQNYLLIKVAQGGTSLYGAWNPNWTLEKAKASEIGKKRQNMKLYSEHIASIHENLNALKDNGITYQIKGMVWMQGEKDSRLDFSVEAYEANLKTLIQSYRDEFDLPHMPFIIGQINCPPRKYKEGIDSVRNGMLNVAKTVNFIGIVETAMNPDWNDFPKQSDNVHYNTEGQKRLGSAFAKQLVNLKE